MWSYIFASGGARSRFWVDSTHSYTMTINKGKVGDTGSLHLTVTPTQAGFSPEISSRSPRHVYADTPPVKVQEPVEQDA